MVTSDTEQLLQRSRTATTRLAWTPPTVVQETPAEAAAQLDRARAALPFYPVAAARRR
jgi:hypothetical protein